MTMTSTTSASPQRASVSLRKTNKPLMEKRRRARINDSLSQLKSLVIQGSKKDSSQFNKLEKADILELTVKHLRSLQDQQQHQQLLSQTNDSSLPGKYQAGFMECANEVIRYLGQSHGFSDDIKTRVIRHLASCIQLSSKASFSKPPIQTNTAPSNTPVLAAAGLQTTNAQLSNGQVIQIVKSPFQNAKVSSTGQHVQPITIAPAVSSIPMSSVPIQIPVAISSNTASLTSSSSEPAHFIKCTQPLHIQIPPALSPVVIQTKSMQHQNQPPPQQPHKTQEPHPQVVQSHLYNVQQETLVTSTSPSPQLREMYIPSPPSKTSKKTYAYYSLDDHYSDFIPRSRTYSFTSSASSESELNSPLNLSQSPQYYERRDNDSYSTSMDSHQFETSDKQSQYFIKNSPSSSSLYHPSSNFASVIVDGRKAVDGHSLTKYMHIIDEDRVYLRSDRSSSSPASSVCEERLWRPW